MQDKVLSVKQQRLMGLQLPLFPQNNDFEKIRGLLSVNVDKQHAKLNLTKNHSINGVVANSQDLLLKYTVKINKRTGEREEILECLGIVCKFVRFRALGDYQYSSYNATSGIYADTLEQFVDDMRSLKFDLIKQIPTTVEGLSPPPHFAPLSWIYQYEYRENPNVSLVTTGDGGEEYVPRFKAPDLLVGAQIIEIDDPVPTGPVGLPPLPDDLDSMPTSTLKRVKQLVELIKPLLEERPILTRHYVYQKLSSHQVRNDHMLARALSYLTYYYIGGPWRLCHVKFGLDPKLDRKMRFYQILDLRLHSNKQGDTFVFDGTTTKIANTIQLCDILKEEFETRIKSLVYCLPVFDNKLGWYVDGHLAALRGDIKKSLSELKPRAEATFLNNSSDEEEQPEPETEMQIFMRQLQEEDDYFDLLE